MPEDIVSIRFYRDSKKWKLGIKFAGEPEKSIVVSMNSDRTLQDADKLSLILEDVLSKASLYKPKLPKTPIASAYSGPISKRIATWPGEIDEGNRDWIIVEISRGDKMFGSIADVYSGSVVNLEINTETVTRIISMIVDLVKRPVKDPRQIEMFAPPSLD